MFSNQEAQWRTLFEYLEIRPLKIVYERLIEDPPTVLANVMKFLGIEVVEFPIRTRMRRQTDFTQHRISKSSSPRKMGEERHGLCRQLWRHHIQHEIAIKWAVFFTKPDG